MSGIFLLCSELSYIPPTEITLPCVFEVLLKSAKELATDSLFNGDLVLKRWSLTVVNKKNLILSLR
jgi:hypothetical protein